MERTPGFAVNGTSSSYAHVVIKAYDTARSADPHAQIDFSVPANDGSYLERAIRAGAAGHFDFVAVHPYHPTAALEAGWEPVFMAITRSVRRMLQVNDPARANVPIWFHWGGAATCPIV